METRRVFAKSIQLGSIQGNLVDRKIKWQRQTNSTIVLNVDGAFTGNHSTAGRGAVLRDHKGNWMEATKGILDMEIQSDSKELTKCLNENSRGGNNMGQLGIKCRDLIRKSGNSSLVHIFREQNTVVDYLAKHGCNSREIMTLFVSPPPGCINFVYNDQLGAVCDRLILETLFCL
ncbi:uncharacterized protein LOC116019658 [Ipomoea triloba]|uniref:uncharacterized protein LOC116019658 n=1 Tax=Ipomoea triloba TaxID=35885 RepID=UPI00125D6491|nr:uncharacterized protein LOC116019658 [Ipomoea triloba]